MATQIEIAEHLDLSDRQVRNLLKDGVLPPTKGRGAYCLDSCRKAYIRHLRGCINGQIEKPEMGGDFPEEQEYIDKEYEQARKIRAEADAQEMKNAVTRREQAPVSLLEWALANIAEQVSSVLDSIPLKLKQRVPHLKASELEIVRREITKCQNAASKSQLPWDQLDRGD
ncbi:terminase small subunit [Endozoicomonas lisbonensis]|uniref:terminase small subunit n=1 Tax=Endozoicomonas lisbonensis TaxID=3120522 RepID=UPI0033975922